MEKSQVGRIIILEERQRQHQISLERIEEILSAIQSDVKTHGISVQGNASTLRLVLSVFAAAATVVISVVTAVAIRYWVPS